jgi:hypothetical protein
MSELTTEDAAFVADNLATFADRGLVVGQSYRITFEDCCIAGELRGTLLRIDGLANQAIFDTGSLGPDWGCWKIEPL